MLNAERHFKDKVVLDVGTGTGVLSIWAAKAGAKKVYAIEADPLSAAKAREAVASAGFSDVVEVVEGISTHVTLPEKVDVLISETVGSVVSEVVPNTIPVPGRWVSVWLHATPITRSPTTAVHDSSRAPSY